MKLVNVLLVALLATSIGCDKNVKAGEEKAKAEETKTDAGAAKSAESQPTANADQLPFEATGPVAKVGGQEIGKDEFNEEVGRVVKAMAGRMPPQMMVRMKDQMLEQLVTKRLIETAVAAENVPVDDATVDAEYKKLMEQIEKNAPGGAKAYFEKMGRTEAQVREDIKKSEQLKVMMQKTHDLSVTDAEAKEYFEKNKQQFDKPEQTHARHILLKLDKTAPEDKVKEVEAKAKDLAKQAKAKDADFAALATQHSEGPTKTKGGDLGFFDKKRMVPEFADAAWKLKPGQVSDPVRTQFGFHIIKVEDRKPAVKANFETEKDNIISRLEAPKFRDAMKATIEELKTKHKVEKMPNNIKTNIDPGMGGGPHGMMGMPPRPMIQPNPANQKLQLKMGDGKGASPKLKLETTK